MFYLDKLVLKFILLKCSEMGHMFELGRLEGALMYLFIFAFGFASVMESRSTKRK